MLMFWKLVLLPSSGDQLKKSKAIPLHAMEVIGGEEI
jgi:hypothetical protein